MRVRADVSAVAVADIRNGGAMGGNAGRFIKVPKYGSFFAIKSVIMVAWKSWTTRVYVFIFNLSIHTGAAMPLTKASGRKSENIEHYH